MRTAFRFFLLNVFLFCFVLFVELLLIKNIFSTPEKIKSMLSQANVYQDMAGFINARIRESSEEVPFVVSASMLRPQVEKFIDDTWDWGAGKTQKPPSLSFSGFLGAAGIEDMIDMREVTKMIADPEIQKQLPPEGKAAIKHLESFTNSGNSVSLAAGLTFVKSIRVLFVWGIPVLGFISLLCLLGIIAASVNNQGRAIWLFFTFLFTSGTLLVTSFTWMIPSLFVPMIMAQMQVSYGEGIFQVILGPITNVLFRQNFALAVGFGMLAFICLLARMMVFRSSPSQMVETKVAKKKNT